MKTLTVEFVRMSDLKELENAMSTLKKTVQQESAELKKTVTAFLEGARKSESRSKKRAGQQTASESAAEMADFEIPVCYGTIELRETLATARTRLKEAIEVLAETKRQMPSQFVQAEMDELQENFAVLREAFARMAERMEMNFDDYTEESC